MKAKKLTLLTMLIAISLPSLFSIMTSAQEHKQSETWKIMRDPVTSPVDFPYVKPEVRVPELFSQKFSAQQILDWQKQCLQDYQKARIVLEDSLADVGNAHSDAINFAKKITGRILQVIEKDAELFVEENHKEAQDPATKKKLITLKIYEYFRFFGSMGKGGKSVHNTGYVGTNPLSVKKVFSEGNFREQMYIVFKGGEYLGEALRDSARVSKINAKLLADPKTQGWQINENLLSKNPEKDPYDLGIYSLFRARSNRPTSYTYQWPELHNDKISEAKLRIPLSEREVRMMVMVTGDINAKIPWLPGASWLQVDSAANYSVKPGAANALPYLQASEETFSPQLSSISSTTDRILTTSHYLGLGSQDDLFQARLVSLAAMVDAQDHSAHEILTSAKSFSLPYELTPDFYKDIYPVDPQFTDKLAAAQKQRGYQLPDYYLQENCVMEKAQQKSDQHVCKIKN